MSPRASRRRGWVHALARVVLVGGAGAGIVLGAQGLGTYSAGLSPVETDHSAAMTSTAYCPGVPFAAEGADAVRGTGSVRALAAPAVALEGLDLPSSAAGAVGLDALPVDPLAPGTKKDPTTDSSELGEQPVRARGTEERAPGMVAAQAFTATGKASSGLALLSCARPSADAWLVGGGEEEGEREHLVLVNSDPETVTAEVSTLGGRSTRVQVPGEGRKVVALDPLRGDGPAQVVHVSVEDGQVAASLAVRRTAGDELTGDVPAGIETVGPTTGPARRVVVPGNADAIGKSLVVAAPGEKAAEVTIRTAATEAVPRTKEVRVPAGEQVDVPLPEVEGMHTWVIESDEPVVAAGHLTTRAGLRGDLAWTVATPPVEELAGTALPAAPPEHVRRYLEVAAADGAAKVEVLVLEDGRVSTRDLSIEDGRSVGLEIGRADAVWVRPGTGRVHAAVLLVGDEQAEDPAIASLPLTASPVTRSDTSIVRAQ